jgi:SHS2 domain-containing protein
MYETFEHTADLGLRVRAVNESGLFIDAARGLFSIIVVNLAAIRPLQTIQFQLQSDSIENLWHDWLSELLYAFHGRRLVLTEFNAAVAPSNPDVKPNAKANTTSPTPKLLTLIASAKGEPIDLERHEIGEEVKAITWHALKVEQRADGWLGEVILDL